MLSKILYKIGFWGIIICAALIVLYIIIPIEFTNDEIKEKTFRIIWFTSAPFFLMTLFKLALKKRDKSEVFVQIFMKIIVSILIFVFLGVFWFSEIMSGYVNNKILFKPKLRVRKLKGQIKFFRIVP